MLIRTIKRGMCMRVAWISVIGLLAPFVAPAQTVVDQEEKEAVERIFSSTTPNESVLKCEVTPAQPQLNFSLRVEADYVLRFPLRQFPGTGRGIDVFLRVTPDAEEAKAVYFGNHFDLPPALDPRFDGEVAGRFVLPPGKYRIDLAAKDDTGRGCRNDWRVEIKPGPVRGTAASLERLTVLLDAAPLDRGTSKPQASDVSMLTSTLESVMEQLPARSVRLVVFNMELEAELFRSNGFAATKMGQVAQALNAMQFATVDYRALAKRKGPVEFVAELVNRELQEPEPANAVIFLGPLARPDEEVPKSAIKAARAGPKFFYVQYRARGMDGLAIPSAGEAYPCLGGTCISLPGPAALAEIRDTITSAVGVLKGRVFIVRTPEEFMHTLTQIGTNVRKPGGHGS
jgi:hypothetical protein